MIDAFKNRIEKHLKCSFNKNQLKDLKRLFYEIRLRDRISYQDILNKLKDSLSVKNSRGRDKFFTAKNALIYMRFPLTSSRRKPDAESIYLTDIKEPLEKNYRPKPDFIPEAVFLLSTCREGKERNE